MRQSCASTSNKLLVPSLLNSHFKGGIIANHLVLCLILDMMQYAMPI